MAELVAVVLAGFSFGVDPGWWVEGGQAVAVEADLPAVVVHGDVVRPAEQGQVVQGGVTAVCPMPDVMCL